MRVYCFWIYEGKDDVDVEIAKMKYNATNIVCRQCKACQEKVK
jgi:hypothetical protein